MLSFAVPLLWIAGWVIGSVLYRRANGKPIIARAPLDADFHEDWRSGRSLRNWFTKVGGARNCLMIYVKNRELVVSPKFPFTLMFLPEIYGLEVRVPVASIARVQAKRIFFSRALRLDFSGNFPASIELCLDNEDEFIRQLDLKFVIEGSRKPFVSKGPAKRFNLVLFRAFMAVWGLGAIAGGLSGLPDDWRYRHDGREAVATFSEPNASDDTHSKHGDLMYRVDGREYRLSSIYGTGTYTVGQTETVYYRPANPSDAREAGLLPFGLMFLGLGAVALALAVFSGKIVRLIT